MTKLQSIVFFSVFGILYLYLHSLHLREGELVMLVVLGIGVLVLIFPVANVSESLEENLSYPEDDNSSDKSRLSVLTYRGSSLNFSDDEMVKILNRHFPYYQQLHYTDKVKFFNRLKKFIQTKTFFIHDESGFKEMPVLVSAAAVQLSFGLDKYLLPFFPHIHIFPEEFIGHHPTIRLLEGNVSNRCINLSWKHFLDGYLLPENGQNVGLHEFAHAYYYQYFVAKENVETDFVQTFPLFSDHANKAFEAEKLPHNDLYSDYALTDFQEFWAESIEIFFEKPALLQERYGELYSALCSILNQDPLRFCQDKS